MEQEKKVGISELEGKYIYVLSYCVITRQRQHVGNLYHSQNYKLTAEDVEYIRYNLRIKAETLGTDGSVSITGIYLLKKYGIIERLTRNLIMKIFNKANNNEKS